MGASPSKSITPQLSSRKLRVNNMMGPTNSLLQSRKQSKVKNVVRPNLIKNSYAMRPGNIQEGNNPVGEMTIMSDHEPRSRSSSISSTGSRNSTSSTISPYIPPIKRTASLEQQPRSSTYTPISRLPARSFIPLPAPRISSGERLTVTGGSRNQRGRKNKNKTKNKSRRRKN
jgi:hypothetical protein